MDEMDPNEHKWAKQSSLERLFNIQWITPRENLLKEFVQTWEEMEDGHIKAQVCGRKILIEQVFIHDQLGISSEGVVDATNVIIRETKIFFKRIMSSYVFVENEQWSVICIKEDFHPRFVTILQIMYQQEQVGYFSNLITL